MKNMDHFKKIAFSIWILFAFASVANAQTCNCSEYIYLNEVNGPVGTVHKFLVNTDGSLDEVFQDDAMQTPWFSGPELPNPHGLGVDANGFLYIGEAFNSGDIRKLTCDGTIFPEADNPATPEVEPSFTYPSGGQFNIASVGNIIYFNNSGANITGIDICTENVAGTAEFCEANIGIDWGFYVDSRTGLFYATSNINLPNNNEFLWVFSEADFDNDPATCITAVQLGAGPAASGLADGLPNGDIRGVVTDELGNIYIAVQNNNSLGGAAMLLKYGPGPDYLFLGESVTDTADDGLPPAGSTSGNGFNQIIGLIYSEVSGLIYASTEALNDDCVAIFNTNLDYLGTAVPAPGGNVNGKGIAIATECCPIGFDAPIDVTLCGVAVGTQVLLQDFIDCDGIICEGLWAVGANNVGLTYNSCDNSITVDNLMGCGTFTLSSVATSDALQCSQFVITINISVGEVEASIIDGDQDICRGDDPDPFTIVDAASGSPGDLTFQWFVSTTSATDGFSPIPGAVTESYDPTPNDIVADIMYFRSVTSVATCMDGSCLDTSNTVLIITVTDPPVVTVPPPFTTCSARLVDLSQETNITPISLGGFWSTPDGNGTFVDANGAATTEPHVFGTAVGYLPSPEDIDRGFVTLVLTTNDPAGPCGPVSDMVTTTILKVDCGTFPWDTSND